MNIKKIIKHICKKTILVICSIMLIMIIGSDFKTVKVIADDKIMTINIADKNGICQAEDGTWNYYRNGKIDGDYTGLAENEAGWWKITNGAVDFTYNGLAENMYGCKWTCGIRGRAKLRCTASGSGGIFTACGS